MGTQLIPKQSAETVLREPEVAYLPETLHAVLIHEQVEARESSNLKNWRSLPAVASVARSSMKIVKISSSLMGSLARGGIFGKLAEISQESVRAACLQNETDPEKLLNRYEKRFEKREKRSEKRSETCLKKFSPSQEA